MPVKPLLPAALRGGPFTTADARGVGVTRRQLRGVGYRRLGSGLYRWVGLKESPELMLTAVARRLPAGAAFSGLTAAWLHGLDVAPCNRVEVTIPDPIGSRRLIDDNRRQNGLVGAGLRFLRFTASDVYGTPGAVAMQVRHELSRS